MGFFFAGILPRSPIGDALVLQFLHNGIVDYDKIVVASEMLAQIKTYVRCHDPDRLNRNASIPRRRSVCTA